MAEVLQDVADLGALEANPLNVLVLKLPPEIGDQVEF